MNKIIISSHYSPIIKPDCLRFIAKHQTVREFPFVFYSKIKNIDTCAKLNYIYINGELTSTYYGPESQTWILPGDGLYTIEEITYKRLNSILTNHI
jgi:hypothetical protein